MTSKPSHVNTSAQSRIQQPLNASDRLLSIVLDLPANPVITYAVFIPTPNATLPHESLELARGKLMDLNKGLFMLDSIFHSVRVEQTAPALYAYKITSGEGAKGTLKSMRNLDLEGLICMPDSQNLLLIELITFPISNGLWVL
jgi:hypothetical protein